MTKEEHVEVRLKDVTNVTQKWSVRQYQKEFTTVLQKEHILIPFYSLVLLLHDTVYKAYVTVSVGSHVI